MPLSSVAKPSTGLERAAAMALALPFLMAPVFLVVVAILASTLDNVSYELTGEIFTWTFVLWHSGYVCFAAYCARTPTVMAAVRKPGPWLGATVLLAAVAMVFVKLDAEGSSYFCAEGELQSTGRVPLWPWVLIGWTVIAALSLPERFFGLFDGQPSKLRPIWQRLLLLPAGFVFAALPGVIFQVRQIDCVNPNRPDFGMMDGGIVFGPAFAIFGYALCSSIAILSAAARDPLNEEH